MKRAKEQESVKHLLQLIQENPELEIMPMVDTECVPSDDFGWWMASWGKVEIEEYWQDDERCYIKSTDEDELFDRFYDEIPENEFTDKEAEQLAQNKLDQLPWIKAICVQIRPY